MRVGVQTCRAWACGPVGVQPCVQGGCECEWAYRVGVRGRTGWVGVGVGVQGACACACVQGGYA